VQVIGAFLLDETSKNFIRKSNFLTSNPAGRQSKAKTPLKAIAV